MTQIPMTNDANKKKYDLSERTTVFSKNIVDFVRSVPEDIVTRPILGQLIRSGTSIGANYHEADEASSKKDFINKVSIAKKETKETKYWLEVIAHAYPACKDRARVLWKEAQELNLIFASIVNKAKNKKD